MHASMPVVDAAVGQAATRHAFLQMPAPTNAELPAGKKSSTDLHVLVGLWPSKAPGPYFHYAAVLGHEEAPVHAVTMQPQQHISLAGVQQVGKKIPVAKKSDAKPTASMQGQHCAQEGL